MHRQRTLLVTLGALLVLAPISASPPPVAAGAPEPVFVEDGLLPPEGAATTGSAIAGPEDHVTLIVRLRDPSLWELYKVDRDRAASVGTQPMSTPTLESLRQAMVQRQRPARQAIEAVGATVLDSYQVVANSFLVETTAGGIPDLVHLRGVASVARAPVLELDLDYSVPHIGAQRVREELGYDGSDVIVAVIDTGTDYTHAAFGGAGTVEAFAANDEDIVEPGSFPTDKVIGGYDFVGARYHSGCQPGQPCTTRAIPDDDPLDSVGHGSHVAGILAGMGAGATPVGVAPGAKLVSLKVFGNPGEGIQPSTTYSTSAVEWVLAHNMGMAVNGFAPEGKIQVVNMSLGSLWSGGMIETNRIFGDLTDSGVTVVSSAGNGGPRPYIVGSPSAAAMVLSVAGSHPPDETQQLAKAQWEEGGQARSISPLAMEPGFIQGTDQEEWLPNLTETGVVSGDLAWYGLACNGDQGAPSPPAQDVNEKVALIERGSCFFYDKMWNAAKLGAIGVLMFTNDRDKTRMGCGPPADCENGPDITGLMIDRKPGLLLMDLVYEQGVEVKATLDPSLRVNLGDAITNISSRGPSRFSGGIKPNITAPGNAILSVAAGTGDGARSMDGTSVAGPHVAGVAALLWQRNTDEDLGLGPLDIAALAMNYADPTIKVGKPEDGVMAPVARQGAGLVNAYDSAKGNSVVRSDPGIAELGFGNQHVLDEGVELRQTLSVRNLSAADKTYGTEAVFAFPDEDEGQGVSVSFEPGTLTVGAKATEQLEVVLSLDPEAIRPWQLAGELGLYDENAFRVQEVDGYVHLTEIDGGGAPVAGGDVVGVPFHVLPRRSSCVEAATSEDFSLAFPGQSVTHRWQNPCGVDAQVEVFRRVATDPAESREFADFDPVVDIENIGLRWGPEDPGDPSSPTIMEWVFHTAGSRRIPYDAEFRVYVDLDRDGNFDRVVLNIAERSGPDFTGRWQIAHAPVQPRSLTPIATQIVPSRYMRYDIDESTTVLAIGADEVGLDLSTGEATFGFAGLAIAGTQDMPASDNYLGYDLVPDNVELGGVLSFDQTQTACVLLSDADGTPRGTYGDTITVPAGGEASMEIALALSCDLSSPPDETALLMTYPDNVPGAARAEVRNGHLGGYSIFLPYASKGHDLRPVPFEVTIDEVAESGISGTATLGESDTGLEVAIQLAGVLAGSAHPALIQEGVCDEPGEAVHALGNVVDGRATTILEGVTLADVADGGHALAIQLSEDNELVVACGAIPLHEEGASAPAP